MAFKAVAGDSRVPFTEHTCMSSIQGVLSRMVMKQKIPGVPGKKFGPFNVVNPRELVFACHLRQVISLNDSEQEVARLVGATESILSRRASGLRAKKVFEGHVFAI